MHYMQQPYAMIALDTSFSITDISLTIVYNYLTTQVHECVNEFTKG